MLIFDKKITVTAADLKLDIFRKLDSLDNAKLKQLYGEFINIINREDSIEEWEYLTEDQQVGILEAEEQYTNGKFKPNDKVMSKLRKLVLKNG